MDLVETGVLTDVQGQSLIDAAFALRTSMETTADPMVDKLFANDKLLDEAIKPR